MFCTNLYFSSQHQIWQKQYHVNIVIKGFTLKSMMQTESNCFLSCKLCLLNDCFAAKPIQLRGMKSFYLLFVIAHFRISALSVWCWSMWGVRREAGLQHFLFFADYVGVSGMSMEKKKRKNCVFCCFPALQAEIRLINSRDNVEMSSMTSILGSETYCAALQPSLCWVNSSSLGRKKLIDRSLQLHCQCALLSIPYE